MLTSIGASTVSRATLRYVRTSYCGSCIKVHRKDWGKGTKKVKPFAYTRVRNWSIKLSGLIHLWAGCSLAENTSHQTGSTKYMLAIIAGGILNPLYHIPSPTIDRLGVSTENGKVSDLCHQHPLERCFLQGKCSLCHVTGEFLVMLVLYTAITSSSSRETKYPT